MKFAKIIIGNVGRMLKNRRKKIKRRERACEAATKSERKKYIFRGRSKFEGRGGKIYL